MARTARNSALETRTARARLRIRRTPYFAKIAKGLRLGYYRGAVAGSWVARWYRGAGVYATEALGIADDTLRPTASRCSTTGRPKSKRGAGASGSGSSPRGCSAKALIRSLTL